MRGKGPIVPPCGKLHRIDKVDAPPPSSSRYDMVVDGDGKKKRKCKYLPESLTTGHIVNSMLLSDGPLLGREFDSLPSGAFLSLITLNTKIRTIMIMIFVGNFWYELSGTVFGGG